MKTPLVGLVLATTAFAGSSVYLWVQLDEERDRAAQVAATTRKLNARIAELEKAREEFNQRRMASGPMVSGTFGSFGTSPPGAVSAARVAPPPPPDKIEPAPDGPVWSTTGRQPSPAFRKMMRSQMRASVRRQYSDLGQELELDKETSVKLIDLLAEQQTSMFDATEESQEKGVPYDYQQKRRELDAQIATLLGPDKARELKAYQETLPARMEADNLARQLEDNGVPLSAAQKKDLTQVVIAEQGRVPQPQYVEGMDQKEYMKAVNDWKTEYDKRIADQASHFFSAEQLSAYNDIQQWQKDMRDQFAAAGTPGVPVGGRMRRNVAPAGAVTFSTAAPAYVDATIVNGVMVSAHESTGEEPKKP